MVHYLFLPDLNSQGIYDVINSLAAGETYQLVVGNTGEGEFWCLTKVITIVFLCYTLEIIMHVKGVLCLGQMKCCCIVEVAKKSRSVLKALMLKEYASIILEVNILDILH